MESFDLNKRLDINKAINDRIQHVAVMDTKRLQDSINKGLQKVTHSLVMPAGNVLFFNGLSTDSAGNVFSLVNYKTITGGKQFNLKPTDSAAASSAAK
ncbi:hypothetical protein HGRIS_000765 [Hohenbuehelia grisea]|uniref:Uncharacterized protein n=1 Tax=Hohenbuehelia grisea TaxID=104357 RepID=A0ABR3IPN6_9AGAR